MQIGVKCVRGAVSHQDCRACALNPLHPCEFPIDVLELMRSEPGDEDAEPGLDSFTPTRLLGCDRQAVLMGSHDYYLDVENAWFPVRGNMVHALMQQAAYPGALALIREHRFKTVVDGVAFTGKPDLVVINRVEFEEDMDEGHVIVSRLIVHIKIVDYKSTNLIGHELVEVKREHELQVNMYAWLVARELGADFPDWHDARVVVDELEIIYADMRKCRRFTSAGWLKTRGKMTSRSPRTYATLDLAPITHYTQAQIGRFIQRRIAARRAAGDELPPVLEGDAAWRCLYCPVREACFALAEGEGNVPAAGTA